MQRERQKTSLLPLAAPPARTGFEDPTDLSRLTPIIRAAQEGDTAAVDTLLAGLASPLLPRGARSHGAAPSGRRRPRPRSDDRGHRCASFVPRRMHLAPFRDPHRGSSHDRGASPVAFGHRLARDLLAQRAPALHRAGFTTRRDHLRSPPHAHENFAGRAPRSTGRGDGAEARARLLDRRNRRYFQRADQHRASRLRLAKDALRNRIEADPRWAELWEDDHESRRSPSRRSL